MQEAKLLSSVALRGGLVLCYFFPFYLVIIFGCSADMEAYEDCQQQEKDDPSPWFLHSSKIRSPAFTSFLQRLLKQKPVLFSLSRSLSLSSPLLSFFFFFFFFFLGHGGEHSGRTRRLEHHTRQQRLKTEWYKKPSKTPVIIPSMQTLWQIYIHIFF